MINKTVALIEAEDGSGDLILPLGEDVCKKLGWDIGDTIVWLLQEDGTITLTKQEKDSNV